MNFFFKYLEIISKMIFNINLRKLLSQYGENSVMPVILTKGRLIYILNLQKCLLLRTVFDVLTLCHLLDVVRFNFLKDLSPLKKLRLLSSSKNTEICIKIASKMYSYLVL